MAGRPKSRARDDKHATFKAVCGGPTQNGRGACQRRAGEGTDHLGVGRCSQHGGNSKRAIREVAMSVAEGSVVKRGPVMGTPIQMDPTDALLHCVAMTAGEVAYLTEKVQELTEADVFVRPKSSTVEEGYDSWGDKGNHLTAYGSPELNIIIKERQAAVDRLARFSKMAIDAGVAERQVALAERQGDIIAHVLGAFMERVGLTSKQLTLAERIIPELLLTLEAPMVAA